MTTIRTTCPKCGAVEMGIEAVLLSIHEGTDAGCYRFLCPNCLDTVEKPADPKIVALLMSVGVDVEAVDDETEQLAQREAIALLETRPPGPPLSVDDLISFHFLLQDDERLARALAFG